MDARLDYPHVHRNREPIANALAQLLPASGLMLEVASGSGQHIIYFAERFPQWTFQPSDPDGKARASTAAWIDSTGVRNVKAPIALDARDGLFPLEPGSVDVVYNANMIHIAPFSACIGLLTGAAACLKPEGKLIMYGPYREQGEHTAASNAAFDRSLQSRDSAWGVRDLTEVQQLAAEQGLVLEQRLSMPANNLLLCYRRS